MGVNTGKVGEGLKMCSSHTPHAFNSPISVVAIRGRGCDGDVVDVNIGCIGQMDLPHGAVFNRHTANYKIRASNQPYAVWAGIPRAGRQGHVRGTLPPQRTLPIYGACPCDRHVAAVPGLDERGPLPGVCSSQELLRRVWPIPREVIYQNVVSGIRTTQQCALHP